MGDTLAPRGTDSSDHVTGPSDASRLHMVPFGHDSRASSVRRVAALMLEHLDGLAVRSASEIWIREAEFRESLGGPEDLFGPCRTTMGSALRSLVAGHLAEQEVSEVRAVGKVASQQGVPLEVVLRGLRVDFLVLWSEMLLVARTTDPTTQQSLINASEIVWGAVDAVTGQFTIGYRSNQEARIREESTRREEVLRRVIAGESVAPSEVADILGFTSTDELVLIVVDARGDVSTEDVARAMRYASLHSRWAHRDEHIVGVVATRGRAPGTVIEALSRLTAVRAGTARPRRGLVDLPGACREATLALAAMREGVCGVSTIHDDPVTVLLLAQSELSSQLMFDFLAPIIARPARERDLLLETIVMFDDAEGVVHEVAKRLYCHRNTVLNRLAKITRLTGISFTSPSGLAQAAMVARAVRFGLVNGSEIQEA